MVLLDFLVRPDFPEILVLRAALELQELRDLSEPLETPDPLAPLVCQELPEQAELLGPPVLLDQREVLDLQVLLVQLERQVRLDRVAPWGPPE